MLQSVITSFRCAAFPLSIHIKGIPLLSQQTNLKTFPKKHNPPAPPERQSHGFVVSSGSAGDCFGLPGEVVRDCIADQASRRSPYTDQSSPQSAALRRHSVIQLSLEAPRICSRSNASGAGRCSLAALPSFHRVHLGMKAQLHVRATTGPLPDPSVRSHCS